MVSSLQQPEETATRNDFCKDQVPASNIYVNIGQQKVLSTACTSFNLCDLYSILFAADITIRMLYAMELMMRLLVKR